MQGFQYLKPGPGHNPKDVLELNYTKDQLESSFIVGNMGDNLHYIYPNPTVFKAILDTLPSEKRVFEEVIYGDFPQRFKLDIDIKESKLKEIETHMIADQTRDQSRLLIGQILEMIIDKTIEEFNVAYFEYFQEILNDISVSSEQQKYKNIINEEITWADFIIATSSGMDGDHMKESYHIIFAPNSFVLNSATDGRLLTRNIINSLPDYIQKTDIIDKNVNKSLQKFRLAGNHKPNSTRIKRIMTSAEIAKILNKTPIEEIIPKWEDLVIRVFDIQDKMLLPSIDSDGTASAKKAPVINDESYYDTAIEIAKQYTQKFAVRYYRNNTIIYNRLEPSICTFCNRIHDNDNTLYVMIGEQGQVYLGCWRQPPNKRLQIGQISMEVDNIKKTKRALEYAYEKIMDGRFQNSEVIWDAYEPATRYSADKMRPYELKNLMVIHANMGLGKTKELVNFLRENFNYVGVRILIISFRQTFTSSVVRGPLKEFGFKVYNEIKNTRIITEPKLIVQVESLHRVSLTQPYHLVILDECESIFSQFGSGLFKTQLSKVLGKFESIMKYTDHVLAMDANISDRTHNILNYFRPNQPIHYHRNSFPNAAQDTWYVTDDQGIWLFEIQKALAAKERVFIPTNSLETANAIHKTLKNRFPEKICIIYTSKTDKDLRKLHFSDVNEYWSVPDYLIITPTCTAGVSYERPYYDKVFPYFTDQSCDVETCRQMVARVRIINSQEYFTYFDCRRACLPTQPDQIRRYICSTQKILDNPVDSTGLETLFDFHFDEYDRAYIKDNIALKLYLENKRIEHLSRNQFAARFIYQLKETGATVKMLTNNSPDECLDLQQALKNNRKIIAEADCKEIVEAEEWTDAQAAEMIEQRNQARDCGGELELTKEEELARHKYFLRKHYNYPFPMEIRFVKIYDSTKTKEIFQNVKHVRNFIECTTTQAFFETLERIRQVELGKNQLTIDENGDQINVRSGEIFTKHRICFALILSAGFTSIDDVVEEKIMFDNIKKFESNIRQIGDIVNMIFGVSAVLPVSADPRYNEMVLIIINKILDIQYDMKIGIMDAKHCVTNRYQLCRTTLFVNPLADQSSTIHSAMDLEQIRKQKTAKSIIRPMITWHIMPVMKYLTPINTIEKLYTLKITKDDLTKMPAMIMV